MAIGRYIGSSIARDIARDISARKADDTGGPPPPPSVQAVYEFVDGLGDPITEITNDTTGTLRLTLTAVNGDFTVGLITMGGPGQPKMAWPGGVSNQNAGGMLYGAEGGVYGCQWFGPIVLSEGVPQVYEVDINSGLYAQYTSGPMLLTAIVFNADFSDFPFNETKSISMAASDTGYFAGVEILSSSNNDGYINNAETITARFTVVPASDMASAYVQFRMYPDGMLDGMSGADNFNPSTGSTPWESEGILIGAIWENEALTTGIPKQYEVTFHTAADISAFSEGGWEGTVFDDSGSGLLVTMVRKAGVIP